jgi:hypothetical protein
MAFLLHGAGTGSFLPPIRSGKEVGMKILVTMPPLKEGELKQA